MKYFFILLAVVIFCQCESRKYGSLVEESGMCDENNDCNFGLKCDSICVEDQNAPDCFKKHLEVRRKIKVRILGAPIPRCELHGEYQPVQCFGSVCNCVDREGNQIGYDNNIAESRNKNCKCARTKDDYRQTKLIGKMFHCDDKGNFEVVQCSRSVCFCIDEDGKKIESSPAVHINNKDHLNC